MTTNESPDDGGGGVDRPKEKPEPTGHWGYGVLTLCIIGLIGWGLFSVGSCAVRAGVRMTSNIKAEMAEADRLIAEAEARKAAVARGEEGQPSNVAVIAGARRALVERAVDPGSVQFRNIRVYRQTSGTKAVCGEFNARNRVGGYNGFERFISAGTSEYTWTEREISDFETAWATHCH